MNFSRKNVGLALALALVALLPGCFEDKQTVTVYPNGSGTIHIWRRLGETLTESQTQGAGDAAAQQAATRKALCALLQSCEGVVAWKDVSAKLDGKRAVYDATGYFEDVTKLRLPEPFGGTPSKQPFSWKKTADGFTLAWPPQDPGLDDVFDKAPTDEDKQNEKQVRTEVKTLRMERTVVLPGKITSAKDATVEDRSATAATDGKDFIAVSEAIDEDRAKIEKKAMTKEAALADVKAKAKKLCMGLEASCGPATDDGAAFAQELEKAKTAYKGSDLEKEIAGG